MILKNKLLIMFEAYFIYSFIFIFTLSSAYCMYIINGKRDIVYKGSSEYLYIKILFWITIFIYTLLLGLRYNVGIDYESYYSVYKRVKYIGDAGDVDLIYKIFFPIMIDNGIHYNFFIAFFAFITIYCLFKAFKDKISLLYIYVFLFFTNLIFLNSINIMRQNAAYYIVLCSMFLFFKKEYRYAVLFYILAFLIHKSCIIFIPFLFFYKNKYTLNRHISIFLVCSSFVVGYLLFQNILNSNVFFDSLLKYFGNSSYSHYFNVSNFEKMSNDGTAVSSGLYKYFLLIIDVVLISNSKILNNKYEKYYFIFFYNLYLFGIITYNIFQYNEITERICRYFSMFRIYILSIYIHNFVHSHKNLLFQRMFIYLVVFLSIIFFYRTIASKSGGCAPWQFL